MPIGSLVAIWDVGILHHRFAWATNEADAAQRNGRRLTLCWECQPVRLSQSAVSKEPQTMPELPKNFFTKEWVVIATERAKRPEQLIVNRPARKNLVLPELPILSGQRESDAA